MDEEAYKEALALLNQLQDHSAGLIRTIIESIADGRVSLLEGFNITYQGYNLARSFLVLLQDNPSLHRDVIHVLENHKIVYEAPAGGTGPDAAA